MGALLIFRVLLLVPQSQMPEEVTESLTEVPAQVAAAVAAAATAPAKPPPWTRAHRSRPGGSQLLANGLREPVNFVVLCQHEGVFQARFAQAMRRANLSFSARQCAGVSARAVKAAVREGLIHSTSLKAVKGLTKSGFERAELFSVAIAHIQILKTVAQDASGTMVANIFEASELVHPDFRERRNELLGRLPATLDLVKLNALRPSGSKVRMASPPSWLSGKVFQVQRRNSPPNSNLWLSNYVVTSRGARKLLKVARRYDTFAPWELLDMLLVAQPYVHAGHAYQFFSVQTNTLSTHCNNHARCYTVVNITSAASKIQRCGKDVAVPAACH
mmetsp:Transcript_21368/g.64724  ORF Transcript_21368/g.64724 Transcript_21368/m.64724 type:complete len:331 (+) Transcript_21368:1-993(+)